VVRVEDWTPPRGWRCWMVTYDDGSQELLDVP
jgi:hypothetical protein